MDIESKEKPHNMKRPSRGGAHVKAPGRAAAPRKALAAPFFLVLGALAVISFILPLRPTVSASEKRTLRSFPAFSADTLLTGEYFDDITAWFSDTFPGREGWIQTGTALQSLRGIKSVSVYGEAAKGDDIPDAGDGAPDATPLPSATAAPTASDTGDASNLSGGGDGLTDAFGKKLDENSDAHAGDNGEKTDAFSSVLVVGDAGYEYYAFSQNLADFYADILTKSGTSLSGKARVFDILVPTGMDITLSHEIRDKFGSSDQKAAIDYIYEKLPEDVTAVDAYGALASHSGEYIYFRTDHHWTGLGAWYAYESFCEAAGLEPVLLTDYTLYEFPDFLGSFYNNSLNAGMKASPDVVYAYAPPGDITMRVSSWNGDYDSTVITDASKYPTSLKYSAFLGGDQIFYIITNDDIADDSACLLIKESFGNAFAPYLTQHYHTVYVVDYRYFHRNNLTGCVETYGIDDVIFINNMSILQSNDRISDLIGFTS